MDAFLVGFKINYLIFYFPKMKKSCFWEIEVEKKGEYDLDKEYKSIKYNQLFVKIDNMLFCQIFKCYDPKMTLFDLK